MTGRARAASPQRPVLRASRLWAVGAAAGRVAIGVGVVVLLFVAYQLWGTAVVEARAQDRLRRSFETALVPPATTPATPPLVTSTTTTTTTTPPELGQPVALLRIPRIGLDKVVVEGAGVDELRSGPGHYPTTPLPGQGGNVAIAGHRTTYGAPFFDLNELEVGDEILLGVAAEELRYVVDRISVVAPDELTVLAPTEESRLTLTTCEPRYSARARLIVSAVLDRPSPPEPTATAAAAPPAPAPPAPPPTPPAERPLLVGEGLGGPAAPIGWWLVWPPAMTALLALGTWLLAGRLRRRWLVLPASPLVVVPLLVTFERASAVLPAGF